MKEAISYLTYAVVILLAGLPLAVESAPVKTFTPAPAASETPDSGTQDKVMKKMADLAVSGKNSFAYGNPEMLLKKMTYVAYGNKPLVVELEQLFEKAGIELTVIDATERQRPVIAVPAVFRDATVADIAYQLAETAGYFICITDGRTCHLIPILEFNSGMNHAEARAAKETIEALQAQIAVKELALVELRTKYSENHPEVVGAKAIVEYARKGLADQLQRQVFGMHNATPPLSIGNGVEFELPASLSEVVKKILDTDPNRFLLAGEPVYYDGADKLIVPAGATLPGKTVTQLVIAAARSAGAGAIIYNGSLMFFSKSLDPTAKALQTTVSGNLNNVSVSDAMKVLFGFLQDQNVTYAMADSIPEDVKVTISFNDVPFKKALDQLVALANLNYSIDVAGKGVNFTITQPNRVWWNNSRNAGGANLHMMPAASNNFALLPPVTTNEPYYDQNTGMLRNLGQPAVRLFSVKYISLSDAGEAVRMVPGISGWKVVNDRLVVQGTEESLARVQQLLDTLDAPLYKQVADVVLSLDATFKPANGGKSRTINASVSTRVIVGEQSEISLKPQTSTNPSLPTEEFNLTLRGVADIVTNRDKTTSSSLTGKGFLWVRFTGKDYFVSVNREFNVAAQTNDTTVLESGTVTDSDGVCDFRVTANVIPSEDKVPFQTRILAAPGQSMQ